MVERWFPGRSRDFIFRELTGEKNDGAFEVKSLGNQIVISGTNGVAAASGFHWYIKNYCKSQVSINGDTTPLPKKLPRPTKTQRRATPFKHRNFFNYRTFGYTVPWWNWQQWEKLIDWMAMNGVNMPLAPTGQEAVWQALLTEQGLSTQQISEFLVGPAFLPWGWMGNIDGMAGPIPRSWIESHKRLQQKILARERSFGMTPILQGFTGHIPKAFVDRNKNLLYVKTTDWAGMPGTYFLDPSDPLFGELGKRFIQIQTKFFGTDHLYSADCFNEVNPPSKDTEFISNVSRKVFASMRAADPKAKWVMQGWFLFWQKDFWQEPQARAFLDPIPDDSLLLLDLYGEKHTVWDQTKAFYGKPWVWNIICNNGQKVNLSGDLKQMNMNLQNARTNPTAGNLSGIGVMMEGFGYNPVVQDLIGHYVWDPKAIDVPKWVSEYATRRYGKPNESARLAWQNLLKSVYSRSIIGESAICYAPSAVRPEITRDLPYGLDYPAQPLFDAAQNLLAAAGELEGTTSFQFDLVHVFREVLMAKANVLIANSFSALDDNDSKAFLNYKSDLLTLLKEMDELLQSNEMFLLGRWIKEARRWGITADERDSYEMNARSIVTLWQPSTKTKLRDHASRQWQGLVGTFYFHRWRRFFEYGEQALLNGQKLDFATLDKELLKWEFNWVHDSDEYPSEPSGNSVEIASRLAEKYLPKK